ncbi:MAG TPA: 50S ribosomal protein L18e [Methanobacterium sp.]|nr:50S ribosomal protein L18e [Methanobacterium sp.]
METKTNPQITKLIQTLKEKSYQKEAAIWKKLAQKLEKSTRSRAEVNLSQINRHTKPDELVLVPGKVLGSGALDHKVQIAALNFSKTAEEKIGNAGGECLDINQLIEKNPTGTGIRIIE